MYWFSLEKRFQQFVGLKLLDYISQNLNVYIPFLYIPLKWTSITLNQNTRQLYTAHIHSGKYMLFR